MTNALGLGLDLDLRALGGALAPVVLSFLTVMLGWRQAFWMLGLAGVAWAAVFYARFRDRPEDDPRCNDAELALIRRRFGTRRFRRPRLAFLRVLSGSRTVWAVCTASFFINFGWYFYATWQPKYWQEVHGIRYADSGWLTGAPFCVRRRGYLAGRPLVGSYAAAVESAAAGAAPSSVSPAILLAGLCILAAGFASTVW